MPSVIRQTEKGFMEAIVQFAKLTGWMVYHTYDSRRSTKGFPDLVLVRRDQLIFAELKTDRGRITQDQIDWIEALKETQATAEVWRPKDWPEIERILR